MEYNWVRKILTIDNSDSSVNEFLHEGWTIINIRVDKLERFKQLDDGTYQNFDAFVTRVTLGRGEER